MLAVERLLEAAAVVFPRLSWPARRATRRTAYAFSGEASEHRVDRFVAGTRLAFILCAFLAIIIDPSRHGAIRAVGPAGPHPEPPSVLARSGPLSPA